MVGTIPSITIDLFEPRLAVAPGETKVRVALLPAASAMEPLFKDNAELDT